MRSGAGARPREFALKHNQKDGETGNFLNALARRRHDEIAASLRNHDSTGIQHKRNAGEIPRQGSALV